MNRPETVTATDVANWVYCPESFRLQELGHKPANQSARDQGTAHHEEKARVERTAGGAISFGLGLIVLAAMALAILWWLRR